MDILISTLQEELKNVKGLEKKYSKKLQSLPRGSFFLRKIGKRQYGYLSKREEGRVVQEYLGVLSPSKIKNYQAMASQKKQYKAQVKSLKQQIKILEKALS